MLLRAFLEAFEDRENVQLVLKVWSTMGYTPESIQEQARQFVLEQTGHDIAADPRIRFVTERLSRPDLLALYRASDAFVLPSRGEGWGRPYMEAMLLGLPTLGTHWSGNTAFMTAENSYLFDYTVVDVPEAGWREVPTYQGHRWAEPNLEDVKRQMRRVMENREEAAEIAARGREHILAHCNLSVVGKRIAEEIARITAEPVGEQTVEILEPVQSTEVATEQRKRAPRKVASHKPSSTRTVRWEGALFSWHSLAHVNREICLGLLASGQVELALVPTEPNHFDPLQEPAFRSLAPLAFAPLSRPADVHVRHFFPPRLERPDEGRFVLLQPWEYGYLPSRWIEPIRENVDEVWCYSQAVKEVYLASGIAGEKLQVVPLGVDTQVFRLEAPPYVFTQEPGTAVLNAEPRERFVFLFVGGTLHRKGIEILLEAYLKAFSSYDDVCLVIKDTGTDTVYRGANERERILGLTADASRPPILYLDQDLTAHQLAGLYTAADCLVQPYRGEGFCLPALEAMACGIPVIVPEGGPTNDFVDKTVGWRVKAVRKPFGNGKIGEWDCVGPTWMLEIDPRDLGRTMREVYQNHGEAKRRGEAAAKQVQEGWTWRHTNAKILERLEALQRMPPRKSAPLCVSPVTDKKRTSNGPLQIVDKRRSITQQPAVRKRPTISLCMIGKNEERVLGACLKSVKPHVDEIVFVDTGSTDRTVEIALSHGAKVHHFPWVNDFSAARNFSIEQACGDWILWVDCDDTLPEACGKALHDLVMLAEERTEGFLMQVHIPPPAGEYGFTIVDHVKIFRN
ncbi:MAG: hypothetical protein JWL77_4809, partial [Chthonomonadaceae bacterium]|nr:hypothetical protein [Chthonomonadaceae bacterium]